MGNKTSQPQANITKVNFNPEIAVLHKTVDPNYGDVKVVRDVKTGDTMILKEIVLNTKQAFEAEQNYLNTRLTVRHPNVVNLIGYNTQDKHNFCSTYYKISLFIEHLDKNLQTEIENRRNVRSDFSEGEVLLIADDMITGLSYFQEQGVSHDDIRPINIFQRNQVYKLSDPSLNAEKGTNALNQAILRGTKTNLAPELVAQVPKQEHTIKTDKFKADVYSLGVTLLSAATLTDSGDLYNLEKGTVDQNLIRERLNIVRSKYSEFTHDLIEDMLIENINERPDPRSVAAKVAPYKNYMRKGYEGLPPSQPESRTDIDVRRQSGEKVKRAGLPTADATDISLEELEARIRAAIARTEETFRIVKATPGLSGVFGEAKRDTTTVQAANPVTTYNYTSTYVPASNYEAPKSSYENVVNEQVLRQSGVGRSQLGQSQDYTTSTYNYSANPTPAGYEYTRTEEKAVRSTPVEESASANAGLRASRANLASSNAQVGGTTTEYNYSYSVAPVTTTTYTTTVVQQQPTTSYESTYQYNPSASQTGDVKVVDYSYSYTSGTQPVAI